jgi:trimeric autotransporter adhesin
MARSSQVTLAFVLAVTSGPVSAQSFYATIRGAVGDATGVIAGVTLTLTDERTGVARTTTTNHVGEYVFANTAPAQYTLTAELTGFKTFERRGLLITVQQALVLDILLEIGTVTEQVIVTGETPTLGRATASVASTIDRAALENLPTTGRNPFLLATTLPSVVPLGTPFFTRMQDQNASSLLSIAGAPPRANTYLVDGVPITDLLNRAALIPSQEALDEVSVQVSTYDASFGRSGGGVFNSTHRSGANRFSGSALFRHRPDWGLADTFFASQIDAPRLDSYNNLWAGTAGGPILRGRTYFFGSTESYRTREIRESVLTLPTELERTGDFSRSLDAQGRLIVIYDPLTTRDNPAAPGQLIRDPFPGNAIPQDRIDPVARALMTMYPLPDTGQRATRTAPVSNAANQATVRIDHAVTDRYRLSATGAWYGSTEPSPLFFGGLPSDPDLGDISREVWMLALNNVWAPGGQTVYEARYGYLSYKDDFQLPTFDVASLDFSSTYVSALPVSEFPGITAAGYGSLGNDTGSRRNRFPSHTITGAVTRLAGRHTIKVGADFRRLGLEFEELGTSGAYSFTRAYTQGPNPNVSSATAGDAIASLLLGLPFAGTVRVGTPLRFSANYYAGYVQDDMRVNPNVTLNLGLRYEFESGLGEADDRFTVGFDRDGPFPVQVPGLDLRGGLMFAGKDGYPTHQSNPTSARFGPRAGFSWSLNERTVVRGGYGLFWSPHQFQSPSENTFGTRGFSATSNYFGSGDGGLTPCTGCQLANPFPNGLEQPQGSVPGLLTGAGSAIHFNDQFRRSPYLHKYSVDVQREFPGAITIRAGYIGSRGGNLDVGGSNAAAAININQLDPSYQALGSALQQQVPNPFFGNAAFGAFGTAPTLARGQLLRPYPQFGNVLAHQVSAGRSRYDSFVLEARRRFHGGWGADVNYTWSRTRDNIIGEGNAFSPLGMPTQLVLNNYDLDAEYGRSLSDLPNRLNVTGIVELPFGQGRRWLTAPGLARAIAGGWTVTPTGFLQSGFPVRVVQADNSGLFGSSQRPDVVPDVDPYASTAGEYDPSCRCVPWLNPLAWTPAVPFTFGNAPRVHPNVRTPARRVWNLAVQKAARTGQATLTFRLEVINLFNSRDLAGPIIQFPQPTFGQILASGGVPRTLQLMVRAVF